MCRWFLTAVVQKKSADDAKRTWPVIVLETHHGFLGLYFTEPIIRKWKDIVESQNCKFYKTTMLRDPLQKIDKFLEKRQNWLSRYLLFGTCGRYKGAIKCGYQHNDTFAMMPYLSSSHIEILRRFTNDFDSVGFADRFDDHLDTIRLATGWENMNYTFEL